MFILVSHVTITTATPPVDIVSSALTRTMIVMTAPSSMGLAVVLDHDVVLPPPFILMDTMRGTVGLTTMEQQQHPQLQIPS